MNFINGVDVSMLHEIEDAGAVYSHHGVKKDIFEILKETNVNAVRLRLWHNPYSPEGIPYGGGTNDLASTIEIGKRIMKYQLDFILDIHYSDFWTDPKKQNKPKAWQELHGEALEKEVYEYTYQTLVRLQENGIRVKYIQIGNEITKGFLWPDGHVENLEQMARLLKRGLDAATDFDPEIQKIIHLDYGTDNQLYRTWFQSIEEYQLDYDIIGMSYYPYWNGSLEALLYNMNDISKTFGKKVLVAETAIGYSTSSFGMKGMIYSEELAKNVPYQPSQRGQMEYMRDLIQTIKSVQDGQGIGFLYWEPEWLPIAKCTWASEEGCKYNNDTGVLGNSWANQALFDESGETNLVFQIFE
ncbi:arabinogalactan endo-1,4-beta-galactosidase [Lachnospiraceae bacterium KM106-2]|nr:arabinogalactan endo-1,4-beta-galactosidase [Lachnospiraceae bacterium KM106-2]